MKPFTQDDVKEYANQIYGSGTHFCHDVVIVNLNNGTTVLCVAHYIKRASTAGLGTILAEWEDHGTAIKVTHPTLQECIDDAMRILTKEALENIKASQAHILRQQMVLDKFEVIARFQI